MLSASAAVQALYDYTASAMQADGALPELYVDGFDVEQIWGQLDNHTGPALKRARKLLKKLTPDMRLVDPDMEAALAGVDRVFFQTGICWESVLLKGLVSISRTSNLCFERAFVRCWD